MEALDDGGCIHVISPAENAEEIWMELGYVEPA